MKKTILSIFSVVALTTAAMAQIPNPGFESWTNVMGMYDNPDGWSTLNNKTMQTNSYTATKGTPGNPGSSYLKLTSRTTTMGVIPGIAVSGKMDTITMMPKSGFAFNQRPASFGGKWQHMIYGSSQGGLSVLLTKWNSTKLRRDTIANGATTLSGMAMSWASFSFNMAYIDSLNYPDSCIIVLKASGTTPTNNDYLWVDGFAFTGSVAVLPPPPPPNLVGLTEINNNISKITLFPNPSSNQVSVSFDLSQNDKIMIQISDMSGKIVKEILLANNVIGTNKINIETGKLAKGIYNMSVKGNNSTHNSKLVIE